MVLSVDIYNCDSCIFHEISLHIENITRLEKKLYNVMLHGTLYHFYAERLLFSVCIYCESCIPGILVLVNSFVQQTK